MKRKSQLLVMMDIFVDINLKTCSEKVIDKQPQIVHTIMTIDYSEYYKTILSFINQLYFWWKISHVYNFKFKHFNPKWLKQ